MSRAARLLDLVQALRRHRRPVSAATLAAELGVSLRTVYRDVATLVGQGAPIAGEAGVGYVLGPGWLLPPLAFTDGEAQALVLGLRFVVHRTDPALARAAADALAKLTAVLPGGPGDRVAGSGLLVAPAPAGGQAHLATLRAAIEAEARLNLRYRAKDGAVSDRVVWPVAVGFFRDAEVLAAWCETRTAFRHFRLDGIEAAGPAGGRMGRRHAVLLADWRRQEGLDALF